MRSINPLYVSFLAATLLGACTDPPKPAKATKEDLAKIDKGEDAAAESALGPVPAGPVAKVGTVEIPAEAFASIYDLKVKKYTDRGREIPTSADRRYRKSIAERLIYHEVLKQEAAALAVTHDKESLAARETQQRRGIRDWEKHLGRRGETEDSLRAMYVAELREKAILEKLGKLEVTEAEIEADYEKIKGNWKSDKPRVRAAHILVPIGAKKEGRGEKTPELSDEEKAKQEAEAKALADKLYAEASAEGADFTAIATAKSTGPSAAKGGDIGIFTADRMAEEFSAAAFAMEVGDISKPVKTKFGFHIIQVTGKWGPGELPKDALEDQIVNRLRQRKLHQGRRQLKEDLLAKYEVVDNIKPTLGPEPQRKRPQPRRHGDGDGDSHGHGGKAELKGHGDKRGPHAAPGRLKPGGKVEAMKKKDGAAKHGGPAAEPAKDGGDAAAKPDAAAKKTPEAPAEKPE